MTREGPSTSSVPCADATAAAKSVMLPTGDFHHCPHGVAGPSDMLVQKMTASASCGPSMLLLMRRWPIRSTPLADSVIGPAPQESSVRNENSTASTVRVHRARGDGDKGRTVGELTAGVSERCDS